MRRTVFLVLALLACAQIALVMASEPAAASNAAAKKQDLSGPAPVPPPGAVLSAAKLKAKAAAVRAKRINKASKTHPAGSIQAKNAKAAEFLASLRAPTEATKPLRLRRSDVAKARRKFDAIVAAQQNRPLPTVENSSSEAVRAARVKRAIARNIARVLRKSQKALAKLAAGTLTAADLAKLQGKRAVKQSKAAKKAAKEAAKEAREVAKEAAEVAKAAAEKQRALSVRKTPKDAMAAHVERQEQEYTRRVAKKKAAARAARKKAQRKLARAARKAAKKRRGARKSRVARSLVQLSSSAPATDKTGALCPNCQQVVLNTNSPVSEHDRKMLAAQHDNLALAGTQLHGQAVLDTAAKAVADAEAQRKEMLSKFPAGAQDSLMQLSEHN